MTKQQWYTIVGAGSGPMPARGPFKSVEDAEIAVENFRGRKGANAGTFLASASARIAGPFASRKAACNADISDAPCVKGVS